MAKQKKTFYPNKRFDQVLKEVGQLFVDKGWVINGVDGNQILAMAKVQSQERDAHSKLESAYYALHESFGEKQEERFSSLMELLNAARALAKKDKATLAQLSRLKLAKGRGSKKKEESGDGKEHPT